MYLPNMITRRYRALVSSIGFYPIIIITVLLALALIIATVEFSDPVMRLKQHWTMLLVADIDTARTLLSVLAGGLISLTVFSFSMVMVVLNNASATLSPRVLPGLITIKTHQYVLGFYLGSIVFVLLTLVNIRVAGGDAKPPSMAVAVALLLGVCSLMLFVFFIHSISRSIQVDNVLNRLFSQTRKKLSLIIDAQESEHSVPDFHDWVRLKSPTAGYFKGVEVSKLNDLLSENNLQAVVLVEPGRFCVPGLPYIAISRDVKDDESLCERICQCSEFYIEEFIDDHYSYGIRQIAEIAVKALSPGINDPGTAVKALDMMSILLIERLPIGDYHYACSVDESEPRLWFYEPGIAWLLEQHFDPIRHFGRNDASILVNLLEALKNILFVCDEYPDCVAAIGDYLQATQFEADRYVHNPFERERIEAMLERIRPLLDPSVANTLTLSR